MKISCIVASVREDIDGCLNSLLQQNFPRNEYEIILVRPDFYTDTDDSVIQISESGKGPAVKRNTGAHVSRGEYLCFFDDDAIIPKNWLRNFHRIMQSVPRNTILGGPNIAEKKQSFSERMSDVIFRSPWGSGFRKKFRIGSPGFCDSKDLSFCNVGMHRMVFFGAGSMNESYLFSEDYEFFNRVSAAGGLFYYSAELFVYHRRRRFPAGHLIQVYNWGEYNTKSALQNKNIDRRPDLLLAPFVVVLAVLLIVFPGFTRKLIISGAIFVFFIEKLSENLFDSILFMPGFLMHVSAYAAGQFQGLKKFIDQKP